MKEIDEFLKKSERFLITSKLSLENGDYDSSVSRCYYAMFYAAQALLLKHGLIAASHKGVITLFGQNFIKTGIIDRKFGRALSDAYDKRIIGDYSVEYIITPDEALDVLKKANEFVEEVKKFIK